MKDDNASGGTGFEGLPEPITKFVGFGKQFTDEEVARMKRSDSQEWTPELLDSWGIDGTETRKLLCQRHNAALAAEWERAKVKRELVQQDEDPEGLP
jgi:hypothetical protein